MSNSDAQKKLKYWYLNTDPNDLKNVVRWDEIDAHLQRKDRPRYIYLRDHKKSEFAHWINKEHRFPGKHGQLIERGPKLLCPYGISQRVDEKTGKLSKPKLQFVMTELSKPDSIDARFNAYQNRYYDEWAREVISHPNYMELAQPNLFSNATGSHEHVMRQALIPAIGHSETKRNNAMKQRVPLEDDGKLFTLQVQDVEQDSLLDILIVDAATRKPVKFNSREEQMMYPKGKHCIMFYVRRCTMYASQRTRDSDQCVLLMVFPRSDEEGEIWSSIGEDELPPPKEAMDTATTTTVTNSSNIEVTDSKPNESKNEAVETTTSTAETVNEAECVLPVVSEAPESVTKVEDDMVVTQEETPSSPVRRQTTTTARSKRSAPAAAAPPPRKQHTAHRGNPAFDLDDTDEE